MSQSSQDCLSQQFTQRPDGVRLRETAKIPRATCKTLQASVHKFMTPQLEKHLTSMACFKGGPSGHTSW